jgi:nucleoside phosphorylase
MIYSEKGFEEINSLIELGVILIVTATPTETEALHQKMNPLLDEFNLIEVTKGNNTYYIGFLGNYIIANVECGDMGSSASAGSIITVSNAITHISPKFVLMVGIAFGVNKTKQNIGDVLVSKTISQYEIQRLGEENIWRGSKPEANIFLRNCFKNIRGWEFKLPNEEKAKIEVCEILSGEKLVDDIDYREDLLSEFPNAKGGEMEGAGLYTACNDKDIPWVLVKSICDFADGKKGEGKKEKQVLAIETALSACLMVFNKKHVFDKYFSSEKEVKVDLTTSTNSKQEQLINLIDEDEIPALLLELNKVNDLNKGLFNRLKKEYKAGLKSIDLMDWKDRMKVFIQDLKI